MANKKNKPLTKRDLLKIEVAKELGIWEQIELSGWGSLSNRTCGQVGGIVAKRLREGEK